MFDKNWVLSELRSGREYEDIMNEISSVLNQASKEYEKETKEETERRNKIENMEYILDSIFDYCIDYYGKTDEDIDKIYKLFDKDDAEKMVDFVDGMMQLINMQSSSADLEKILGNFLAFLK